MFGRPIGQNQGDPASAGRALDRARGSRPDGIAAAAAYDRGQEPPVGADANAAKYCAAEAGFHACETAVMTHGGMGYAKEYHVERYFREIQIARIAPVSPQLILSHIAERVLGCRNRIEGRAQILTPRGAARAPGMRQFLQGYPVAFRRA